jgi:hypothetical protein
MSRFQHWKGERAFIFNQATHLQGPAFKLDYFEQRVLTAIKAMPETVGLLGLGLMWGVKAEIANILAAIMWVVRAGLRQ